MVASNIFGRGFGEVTLNKILDKIPDILTNGETNIIKKTKLLKVEGVASKTADNLISHIKEFLDFMTIANTSLERSVSSFPSAHTGLSILVAYSLWPYMNTYLKGISCFVILAVAISRTTLAMHYPADIMYSILVTILIIFAGNFVFIILKNNAIKSIGNRIFRLISP